MKMTLDIALDNAAFEGGAGAHELGRILEELARKVSGHGPLGSMGGKLREINGNTVGSWAIAEEPEIVADLNAGERRMVVTLFDIACGDDEEIEALAAHTETTTEAVRAFESRMRGEA